MLKLSPQEVEKRIQAWADVTLLSLERKRAALRKRCPHRLIFIHYKPMTFKKVSLLRA